MGTGAASFVRELDGARSDLDALGLRDHDWKRDWDVTAEFVQGTKDVG